MRTVQTDTLYFSYINIFAVVITDQIVLEMMKVPQNGQLEDRKPARWSFSINLFVLTHTVKAIRAKGAPSQDLPQVKVKIIDDNSQITELLLAKCKWTMLIILEHGNTEREFFKHSKEERLPKKKYFYMTLRKIEKAFFLSFHSLSWWRKKQEKSMHSWCWRKTNFNYTKIVLVQEELNPIKCDPYCISHIAQIQGELLVTNMKITLIIQCCKYDFPKGL